MVYKPDGLSLRISGLSGQRHKEWLLDSEDNTATVNTAGYITDAVEKGLQVGDIVFHRQWTTFTNQYTRTGPLLSGTLMFVASIAANGSADLTDGTAIVTTDSD